MITREEYIKALDIVEGYHRQINAEIAAKKISDKFNLRNLGQGDLIYCEKTTSKYLTVGKRYQLMRVGNVGQRNWWGEFRNDKGDIRVIGLNNYNMWSI